MKLDLSKLSKEAPSQHIAILVLAGVFIFINLMDYVKRSGKEKASRPEVRMTAKIDEMTGQVTAVKTRYLNPQISWYQAIFCRGFQRSSSCSMKMLHPKAQDAADYGIKLPEGAPETDGVVYYKGSVNKNMAFSQELVTPQADEAPIKIMRYDSNK